MLARHWVAAGAAGCWLATGFGVPATGNLVRHAGPPPLEGCRAIDGDTLRCGRERIRLLGIDAPELPGHCRVGRLCVTGNPYASRQSLARALAGKINVQRVGVDRYGRTPALVSGSRGDLSCWQIMHRQAIYKRGWDNGGLLADRCGAVR